jgi:hypothetical protein
MADYDWRRRWMSHDDRRVTVHRRPAHVNAMMVMMHAARNQQRPK